MPGPGGAPPPGASGGAGGAGGALRAEQQRWGGGGLGDLRGLPHHAPPRGSSPALRVLVRGEQGAPTSPVLRSGAGIPLGAPRRKGPKGPWGGGWGPPSWDDISAVLEADLPGWSGDLRPRHRHPRGPTSCGGSHAGGQGGKV